MRMKADEWDDVLATNLSGVYRVSKACVRGMMKAKKGRIINIASVIGIMGNAGQSNYAAAKAGIIGFSKSLAREIGSRNITVNVVAPGFIDTDMTRVLPEEQKQGMLAQVPLGRLGEGDDIANAVVFLASAGRRIYHRRDAARERRHADGLNSTVLCVDCHGRFTYNTVPRPCIILKYQGLT